MEEEELYHSDTYLGDDYSDGIKHWKYIKREKMSNGKYRYWYKESSDNITKLNKTSGDADSKYGTYEHYNDYNKESLKIKVNKSNKLLSSTSNMSWKIKTGDGSGGENRGRVITRNIGLIEQNIDYVKKQAAPKIAKAKKWLSDLFKK